MAPIFEFAVLKLEPDALRGETVNLGLVIFKDDHVDVRIGEVLTRAKLLYPGLDSHIIRDGVETLKRFGASKLSPDARWSLIKDLGLFKLGQIGRFSVEPADGSYEKKVQELLRVFTSSGRRIKGRKKAPSKLVTAVRRVFRQEKLLSTVGDAAAINEHKIVPEWPIPTHPSLKTSLAVKNGLLRVCEVADLTFEDQGTPPRLLFESAVTLDIARRDANAKDCVFAYRAFGPAKQIDEALTIVRDYASRLVDWESARERQLFVEEWMEAARSGP